MPYQDVQPTELIPDEIREPGGAAGVGDVELVEVNLGVAAGAPDALDRFQTPRIVPRRQDDPDAPGRQLPARLEPDALVPSRHQRDPGCAGKNATGVTRSVAYRPKGTGREIRPAHGAPLARGARSRRRVHDSSVLSDSGRRGRANAVPELERIQASAPFPRGTASACVCRCQTAVRLPKCQCNASACVLMLSPVLFSRELWAMRSESDPVLGPRRPNASSWVGLAAFRQQRSR